ncbi:hypothetical protein [Paludisphaera rhizosphaerae]|uniref:hypothetical protein n=1 Tax=Paludisphaera rhizosphaerae TaxID=2711216 RepID=UPI0013EBC4A5|nr:hypothetical protein [Paludisphaera rhizosphaerae]
MRLESYRRNRRWIAGISAFGLLLGANPPALVASDWLDRLKAKWHGHKGIASAEALAGEIDCLEKHVDWYGTIVAKQPDVWGQARLMKYRDEFEKTLSGELGKFTDTLQASISRSDQAFLAQALSLSAAVSGTPATMLPPSASTSREVISRRRAALRAAGVTNPTPEQLGAGEELPTIDPPDENAAGDLIQDFNDTDVIQRRDVATSTNVTFGDSINLSLEPAERLDQLKRYVDHLHEIRRVNEGDDTADSPGYGLHLVRLPVSILPGTHTRHGYGAEITVTATPYLGRDLLPTTFRNLVVNDLVEQLTTPLTEFFNSPTSRSGFLALRKARQEGVKEASKPAGGTVPVLGVSDGGAPTTPTTLSLGVSGQGGIYLIPDQEARGRSTTDGRLALTSRFQDSVQRDSASTVKNPIYIPPPRPFPPTVSSHTRNSDSNVRMASQESPLAEPISTIPPSRSDAVYNRAAARSLRNSWNASATSTALPSGLAPEAPAGMEEPPGDAEQQAAADTRLLQNMRDTVGQGLANVSSRSSSVPGLRARNARYAFPSTQMGEVYGPELILPVAFEAFDVQLRKPLDNKDDPTLLLYHRVAGYVQDQVTAAYDMLSRPESAELWSNFATPDLARAVQSRDEVGLRSIRSSFLASLPNAGIQNDPIDGPKYTTTAAMAWAILVESVMLNERLIQDIRESATAKGGAPVLGGDQAFFLPCPSDEARDTFNEYVRNRFPIHVFALDPVNQEQNLADQLTRSREMQFALSLAFVTGNISARSMTRFARRLELQAETIALNRTQIGFSHGEDTFGWRFQPRYQTPPTQNNLVALRDTILGGPTREQDRRQLELEPGQRECVALVIMPSFVPYVTFETRSNWYKLNSPKHSEIDPVTFLKLSGTIKRAFLLAQGICDAGLYRDGDVALLVNRVKQLAAELPMQSMIAQVPYENTSGGFELFNVGVTDLAPELRSWYGSPGVSIDNGSSLFLVGDNFSVNQTSVVVGNKLLTGDDVTLLSRQVMQVKVPAGAQTVVRNGLKSVEASIATPYGVSQSLYIPVLDGSQAAAKEEPKPTSPTPTFTWSTSTLALAYRLGNLGIVAADRADGPSRRPAGGLVIGLDSGLDLDQTLADLTLSFADPDKNVRTINLTNVPYSKDLRGFVISEQTFDSLVTQLFADERFGLRFGEQSPPRDVIVGRTAMRLKGFPKPNANGDPTFAPVVPADVSNQLTIKWFKAP